MQFLAPDERVTLVFKDQLSIWNKNTVNQEHFECLGSHVVHSTDENQIVLYSRSWLHYLTQSGNSVKILSVFKDFPLTQVQSSAPSLTEDVKPVKIETTNELTVPASGKTISRKVEEDSLEARGHSSTLGWLRSIRIDLCTSNTNKYDAHKQNTTTEGIKLPQQSFQQGGAEVVDPTSSDVAKGQGPAENLHDKNVERSWHALLCTYEKRMDRQLGEALPNN
jgi:hypothetical protein